MTGPGFPSSAGVGPDLILLRRLPMTESEADKVFSIFTGLLESIQTSVFQVDGVSERLILRKTFPTHFALCSWPLGTITGFFPYSLALDNQALGCRHSIGTTSTDLIVCIAAPHLDALHQALSCIRETNDLFVMPDAVEPPKLPLWVRGPNGRIVEIPNYQGEDLSQLDLESLTKP